MTEAVTATLSRQSGLMKELSVLANNIANAGTAGFKREAAIFAEYVKGHAEAPSTSIGRLRAHYTDHTPGAFDQTGRETDFAILGKGFFAVEREEEMYLTRAGGFRWDDEGSLVTPDGDAVLDEGGKAIQRPQGGGPVVMSDDGVLSVDGQPFASLGVMDADENQLTRLGGGLWTNTGPLRVVEQPTLRQGVLEGSNVAPVREMARLIETQRLYEAGATIQNNEDERIRGLIDAIGQG
ncbi:MAG: flagellar hook-basal body complex protein [Parvularcula sp.]|jgi:flagellar basal-body rod protein FlgF|nr:flagellar hook-basal body complex protein [Parvularcula sp.]